MGNRGDGRAVESRMKRAVIALAVALSAGLTGWACGSSDDDDASPTAPASITETQVPGTPPATAPPGQTGTPLPVPGAVFGTDSGVLGRMTEGTRCWANVCQDMVGPVTLRDPAAVAVGIPVNVAFEGGDPDEVSFAWVDVAGLTPIEASNGTVTWAVPVRNYTPGDAIVTPAMAGDYVLTVFAKWDSAGDIVFSTYFRIG